MRILIAEDDQTSRMMLSAVLKKYGHETVVTVNGIEAWDVLQKADAPRLAILDWMMPEMDGLAVVRRVRAEIKGPQPYLIMLTTKAEKEDIVAGLDAGADDYLSKPFHPAELRARVQVGKRLVETQDELTAQITKLQQALDHIKALQGILPICMHCKKIRNDAGYWEQVESYISHHSDALFSHSICAECLKKHYPEFSSEVEEDSSPT